MAKRVATIAGAILLAAGVGVAILHYVMEGSLTDSYITLAIAAVLLIAGWTLFERGTGISRRRREDDDGSDL
ncbi:MAG: hypothetical protein GX113_06275 [Actinobacteria bacterium]|jgi:hypothetical protein|nr:hypothetical protein [Actinomycetota bacterium]